MRIQELGQKIRRARNARALTQAELASNTRIARETLNRLEQGLVPDLGFRKVLALLEHLGLSITVEQRGKIRRPDYLRMACTTANVSFKSAITEEELVHALITGKVPAGRAAHLRSLLDEAPADLLRGLGEEAAKWTRPGKLQKNLERLARDVGASRRIDQWLKIG